MSSTTRTKILCSKCNKVPGILTCRGCQKDFCYRHVAEHREELNKQMDELTMNHDQLHQTIVEQREQPKSHPLFKQIDIWEQNAIEKIHQTAKQTREQLLITVDKHRTKVAQCLSILTEELTKGRNDDDFVETDLQEWTDKLEKLKIDLAASQTIDFGQIDNDISLIPKIFIYDDSFKTWFGDIQVTEYGRLISHGQTKQAALVYSKSEYLCGQHTFRFKIEHLSNNQPLYFGITTKDTSSNPLSFDQHNLDRALQKILRHGSYSVNGINLFSLNNYINIIQINDILEFQLDCDRQKIRISNQRTNFQQEFNSNLNRCPLPWRFVICLLHPGDRIRLC